jgi:hypothetical protein
MNYLDFQIVWTRGTLIIELVRTEESFAKNMSPAIIPRLMSSYSRLHMI